jgi:hypothetical protein
MNMNVIKLVDQCVGQKVSAWPVCPGMTGTSTGVEGVLEKSGSEYSVTGHDSRYRNQTTRKFTEVFSVTIAASGAVTINCRQIEVMADGREWPYRPS